MSIDTAQWSHGPGSFPETIAANSGVDSTTSSISQRSSHEGDSPFGANISFVYANEKRFSDYHGLFRSVPEKEKLIEGKFRQCFYFVPFSFSPISFPNTTSGFVPPCVTPP